MGDVVNPVTGEVIVPEGKMIDLYDANEIEAAGITKLKIRSLLTCRAKTGVCARCYGSDMANGEPVRTGRVCRRYRRRVHRRAWYSADHAYLPYRRYRIC